MLDKISAKLIKVLNKLSVKNTYNVLELREILNNLQDKNKMDEEVLLKNLEYLAEREFIDIKYSDENEVCLCLLPKSRRVGDEMEEIAKIKKNYISLAIISSIFGFAFAFLGAFLAIILFK